MPDMVIRKTLVSSCLVLLFACYVGASDISEILRMKKIKTLTGEASGLFKAKRFKEASKKVVEGFAIEPEDFDLLVLSGKIFYSTGDLISAHRAFARALKQRPADPYVRDWLSRLNVRDGRIHTEHFIFYRVPISKKWVTDLLLEKAYHRISEVLDAGVPRQIELWFFESEEEFFRVYGMQHVHKKGKLLGVSQYKKNRILISSHVSRKSMLSVISHELVHFFLHHRMPDSRLYGIEEGLANFVGGRRANYKVLEKGLGFAGEKVAGRGHRAIDFRKYIFHKFSGVHDYRLHTALYYEVSTALIEFIHHRAGKGVLKCYINDLMRTDTDYYRLLWASMSYVGKEAFERDLANYIQGNIRAGMKAPKTVPDEMSR